MKDFMDALKVGDGEVVSGGEIGGATLFGDGGLRECEQEQEDENEREGEKGWREVVWSVRGYGEKVGDYQMVCGWSEERGMGMLLENTLPPTGIIVEADSEAVAASWLYLCYGIGVGFWEGLIARPGLSLKMARAACGHCVGALKAIAAANDTGLIKTYAKGALAWEAERHGFIRADEGLISLFTTV